MPPTITQPICERLLRALQDFEVEQFVYAGTMLVHAPVRPGERIDEQTADRAEMGVPESKAAAEAVIREEHGRFPTCCCISPGSTTSTAVPTLAHQIARIYERGYKSHFYAGDLRTGQAFVHEDDMVDAFRRAIDRRERPAARDRRS